MNLMEHGHQDIMNLKIDSYKEEFLADMFDDTRIDIVYAKYGKVYHEIEDLSKVKDGLWTATVIFRDMEAEDLEIYDRACEEYEDHFHELDEWMFHPGAPEPCCIVVRINQDMSIYDAYQYILRIRDNISEDVYCLKNKKLSGYQIKKVRETFPIYQRAMKKAELELSNFTTDSIENAGKITALNVRLKSLQSIEEKVYRKNICQYDILERFDDIAGVKCVCEYLDDVYDVLAYIKSNSLLNIIDIDDKIEKPSPQGYRGVHIVVGVDVFFQGRLHQDIKVEIQLRTAFQDAWSAKTHELTYKKEQSEVGEAQAIMKELSEKLKEADELALQIKHKTTGPGEHEKGSEIL